MKVLILGSGIIGVTTAYYLGRSGHEVMVVDRRTEAGMETSFANAGQISPGYSGPWAAPGVPVKAIRWLLMNTGRSYSGRDPTRRSLSGSRKCWRTATRPPTA